MERACIFRTEISDFVLLRSGIFGLMEFLRKLPTRYRDVRKLANSYGRARKLPSWTASDSSLALAEVHIVTSAITIKFFLPTSERYFSAPDFRLPVFQKTSCLVYQCLHLGKLEWTFSCAQRFSFHIIRVRKYERIRQRWTLFDRRVNTWKYDHLQSYPVARLPPKSYRCKNA